MRFTYIILFLAVTLSSCGAPPQTGSNLIIATATPGGTYYPVGVALGTLITQKLQPDITASAINSAGSGENIQMLVNGEAHLAILQGLFGATAYHGKGTYQGQPVRDIRSITMLWQNVEHFLLRKEYVRSGDVGDLKNLNRKFSIGKRGSGTEGSTLTILEALGIDPETDFTPEYLGYGPSAQAMIDNRIVGASIPAGPPVPAVTQAFAQLGANGMAALSFTDAQLQAIRQAFPVWTRHRIPTGAYPGQTSDIHTIAQPNFLACRAALSEGVVYTLTKTIYENLPEIQNIHKATLAMSLEHAIDGLAVPLHPGAARYYREQGLKIPLELIAQ